MEQYRFSASVTVTNKGNQGRVAGDNKDQKAVKTGDTTPVIPLLVTMVAAGLAALYLAFRRKRKQL